MCIYSPIIFDTFSVFRHTYLFAVGYSSDANIEEDEEEDESSGSMFRHDPNQPHNAASVAVNPEVLKTSADTIASNNLSTERRESPQRRTSSSIHCQYTASN